MWNRTAVVWVVVVSLLGSLVVAVGPSSAQSSNGPDAGLSAAPSEEGRRPVCPTVHLGFRRLTALERGPHTTEPVAINLLDGEYRVTLESIDRRHGTPDDLDQPNEKWSLEGLDAKGEVVFTSGATDDLPTDEVGRFTMVGTVNAEGVTHVRARHAGPIGGEPNSIQPVRASFAGDACVQGRCVMVDLGATRLLGFNNPAVDRTKPVHRRITDGAFRLLLTSSDPFHAIPDGIDQPNERWYLEGLDEAGRSMFQSAPTDDLPPTTTTRTYDVGFVRSDDVVALQGFHANVADAAPNSIQAVSAVFDNGRCRHRAIIDDDFVPPSRLSAIAATSSSVVLRWFPGMSGDEELTYEVFVDGESVADGIDGLSYQVEGLAPGVVRTFSVRAQAPSGAVSAFADLEAGPDSANQCAGRIVTVDLALGQQPTDEDDVILGTSGDDVINGGPGDDVICGNGGSDRIDGGPGGDNIVGSDGDDELRGGEGADEIAGFAGVDTIDGGPGDDRAYGGPGNDRIAGGPGSDYLDGESDDDTVDGGQDDDTVIGSDGNDTLDGGAGSDTVSGGAGVDIIRGDGEAQLAGDDMLEGGDGDDRIDGDGGNDELQGQGGNDTMNGGPGDDRMVGGDGANTMDGGPGADLFVRPTPESTFQAAAEDTVEEIPSETEQGGFVESCSPTPVEPVAGAGEYECFLFLNLFEYSPSSRLRNEYGIDLYFNCEAPLIRNPLDSQLQCSGLDGAAGGLPANYVAFTESVRVDSTFRRLQRAYATFRQWGLFFPVDAYEDVDDPDFLLPLATTVVTFNDDPTFRSRSTTPGLIEYGRVPSLSQSFLARDLFTQFILARIDTDDYAEHAETLESLAAWAGRRVAAGDDDPLPCIEDLLCSRSGSLRRGGALLWEHLFSETGGYGFIDSLLFQLSFRSFQGAMNSILGRGWEDDFLQTGLRRPDIRDELAPRVRDVETNTFVVLWDHVDGAASYEVLVGNTLWIDGIAAPTSLDPPPLAQLIDVGGGGDGTRYSVQVRARNRTGQVVDSRTVQVRTPSVPADSDFDQGARILVSLEQCTAQGGDIYLDESALATVGPLIDGRQIARGCFDLGESPCLAEIAANPGERIDCEDAVTRIAEPLAEAVPRIGALQGTGFATTVPLTTTLAFADGATGQQAATLVLVSGASLTALKVAAGGTAAGASTGLTLSTLAIIGGVFVLVAVIVGVGLYLWWRSTQDRPPIPCNQLAVAVPTGFDGTRPDFSLYQDEEAMKQLTQCPDIATASVIYGTIMHTIYDREPDLEFSDEDEVLMQIDRACRSQEIDCDDELVVYVPGGSTYNGGAHRDTGLHIRDALGNGPVIWHYPAYTGPRNVGRWYDSATYQPNECTGRTFPRNVCDEFPFASTDQRIDQSGTRASLRPVLSVESGTQGNELSRFYRECLDNELNKRFLVISPTEAYIEASGRSFAFKISPWDEIPESCL